MEMVSFYDEHGNYLGGGRLYLNEDNRVILSRRERRGSWDGLRVQMHVLGEHKVKPGTMAVRAQMLFFEEG